MIQGKLAELFVELSMKDKLRPALNEAQNQLKEFQDRMNQIQLSPNLVTGFQENLMARQAASMQARIASMQAGTQFVASPQGKAAVQEQMKLQGKLVEEQKRMTRELRGAEIGKFGAGLERFQESMKGMSEGIARVIPGIGLLMGAGALGGMAAAASPEIWQTFTLSLQYLAGSIGNMLLPTLTEMISVIQSMARWFYGLDEGTRNQISSWVRWGAIVIAGAAAFRLLLGVLSPIVSVLAFVWSGLSKVVGLLGIQSLFAGRATMNMSLLAAASTKVAVTSTAATGAIGRLAMAMRAFVVANPFLVALAGIGALLGVGAMLFGGRSDGGYVGRTMSAEDTVSERRGRFDYAGTARGIRDTAEVEAEELRRALGSRRWGRDTRGIMTDIVGASEGDRTRAFDLLGRREAAAAELRLGASSGSERSRRIEEIVSRFEARREADAASLEVRGDVFSRLRAGGADAEGAAGAAGIAARLDRFRREMEITTGAPRPGALGAAAMAGGAGGAAPATPVTPGFDFQSQFLGIEQRWAQLQQQAASGSPLEAEMRVEQRRALARFMAATTDSAVRTTTADPPRPGGAGA